MRKIIFILTILLPLAGFTQSKWYPFGGGMVVDLYSIYFSSSNKLFTAGGQENPFLEGVIQYVNEEETGGYTEGFINSYFKSVFFTSADTGYASGYRFDTVGPAYNGRIKKTVDGGIHWTTLNFYNGTYPGDLTPSLNAIYFTDAENGYAVGDSAGGIKGLIIKTTDAGTTWSAIPTPHRLNSVFFFDFTTGYAVGDSGIIVKTIDAGANWTALASGTNTSSLTSVQFPTATTGYVCGGDVSTGTGIILKTMDGGITWEPILNQPENFIQGLWFTDASTGYVVGGDLINGSRGIIFKTFNGGLTWPTSLDTTVFLTAVKFVSKDTGFVVGRQGLILRTTAGGGLNGVGEAQIQKLTLYPNPASEVLTIETLESAVQGELSIRNITGQQLISRHISDKKTTIGIRDLPAGVYVVQLTLSTEVSVARFIKK